MKHKQQDKFEKKEGYARLKIKLSTGDEINHYVKEDINRGQTIHDMLRYGFYSTVLDANISPYGVVYIKEID